MTSSLQELEQLEYESDITNLLSRLNTNDVGMARRIALDMWKHFPDHTMMLVCALSQTQHTTKKIPMLCKAPNES